MLKRVRTIADYQFGRDAGRGLFPDGVAFQLSSSGRVRQILLDGVRLATLRAHDGRLTLSIAGALRLQECLAAPAYRVVIRDDVAEFILRGKNAFARHVVAADPGIRAGDEVLVVQDPDRLLGTGAAVLSGAEMLAFNYGVAVKVRQGRESGCFQEE
ncbi:MAG: pseudouridine synthase [Methanomicrobiales archaeon]|nr:pseudouridine synthase [Methanomicrobiales archaeon]MDI6877051.1 pseudouridine synthase [Methanomicrobiales archaeon]